ncbi:hypothetical protein GCU67_10085 [Modestobacter muralis]|uniref:Uncharacterized protein n=1 Tax=Modestobacter muralis TaxID=1608614 RepID=A0A6P0H9C3_9ACTN|nr:hypothetical protein [Modestobacter muralis]NEK94518.1 hypothetical protein [Modestobacter muralis]NEN51406.1 hypothetical protein [Modestobacter muralis]
MVIAVISAVWVTASAGLALVVGRGIRTADARAPFTDHLIGLPVELTVAAVLGARTAQPSL